MGGGEVEMAGEDQEGPPDGLTQSKRVGWINCLDMAKSISFSCSLNYLPIGYITHLMNIDLIIWQFIYLLTQLSIHCPTYCDRIFRFPTLVSIRLCCYPFLELRMSKTT